jgi:hypothetical protein
LVGPHLWRHAPPSLAIACMTFFLLHSSPPKTVCTIVAHNRTALGTTPTTFDLLLQRLVIVCSPLVASQPANPHSEPASERLTAVTLRSWPGALRQEQEACTSPKAVSRIPGRTGSSGRLQLASGMPCYPLVAWPLVGDP